MPGVVQQEWLNQNALRAYPFSENAQRRPSSESGFMPDAYALPNGMILDVVMSVPADTNAMEGVYLSRMTLSSGVVTFVFSDVVEYSIVASVSIDLSSHENYGSYLFSGSGAYADVRGGIVIGEVSSFSNYPDGVFSFVPDETRLETRCVRPDIACVRSIGTTDSEGQYSTIGLQGDVKLIAGTNIRLRYDEEQNAIWIDADYNSGYNEVCTCGGGGGGGGGGGDDGCSGVRSINGISVESVVIEGGDCISVKTENGVISITDTCSKPCAGCEELNFLNTKANGLLSSATALSNYADLINNRLSEFEAEFILAKSGSVNNA